MKSPDPAVVLIDRFRRGRTYSRSLRVLLGHRRRDVAQYAKGTPQERVRLRRGWVFTLARRYTPVIAVRWPSGTFLLPTDDNVVGRSSYVDEPFGLGELQEVCDLLETGLAGPIRPVRDHTVLEIGANIGTTTVPLLTVVGARRVVAFEPAPGNAALLRAVLALNGMPEQVDVHQVALSDAVGTVVFATSPRNTGDYRVRVPGPRATPPTSRASRTSRPSRCRRRHSTTS